MTTLTVKVEFVFEKEGINDEGVSIEVDFAAPEPFRNYIQTMVVHALWESKHLDENHPLRLLEKAAYQKLEKLYHE